ncbi:MAG: hypothetical protein A3J29_17400 [Acidobacteria bacterium RIFCSPLOWO2_12_FULL_67_14b]|nr:MAG: hypothetical protein A3J29_17400 [Acidobacteria bacterium RIFCSPLOWO2_12_FULL_67_14b]
MAAGTTGPAGSDADNLRGVALALVAVVAFVIMSLILKHLAHQLPLAVIAFFRLLFSLLVLGPWALSAGTVRIAPWRLAEHAVMTVVGVGSLVTFVYSLDKLILADAMALAFSNPLWSILLSVLILREPVRLRRWTATAIGFLGVLMIVRPAGQVQPAMIMALLSAVFTSLSVIMVKRLSAIEPAVQLAALYSLMATLLTFGPAIATWQTPDPVQLAWLAAAGLAGLVGQVFQVRAVAVADVTLVAPLDFLRPPLGALVALVLWSEVPDGWTVAGTAVIALASAYIARREAVVRKAPRAGRRRRR